MGSTDGTRERLIQNRPGNLILNEGFTGMARARNQIIRASGAEWIAFISARAVVRDRLWLDKMWNWTVDKKTAMIEGTVYDEKANRRFAGDDCFILRRAALHEVGYYDEHFLVNENHDLCVRLLWAGLRIVLCDDTDILCAQQEKDSARVKRDNKTLALKYTDDCLYETLRKFQFQHDSESKLRGW
jgi:hypothetical protein